MPTALALAGGGSRGAFQVGALRYLYGHEGVQPDIICSTSVGSINGVKLAEAGPHTPHYTKTLDELLALWRSRKGNQDMWEFTDFVKARPALQELVSALAKDQPQLPALPPFMAPLSSDIVAAFFGHLLPLLLGLAEQARPYVQLAAQLKEFLDAKEKSFLNLNPIKNELYRSVNSSSVVGSGVRLRLAMVSLDSGTLRYATETGDLLERDNKTKVPAVPAQTTTQPVCDAEEAALDKATQEWNEATADLKAATGTQEKKDKAKIVKDKLETMEKARAKLVACRAKPAVVVPTKLDVRHGTMASASIPIAFAPVDIYGESYVDGGVRELLPLHAAVLCGADTIYAIPCSALIPTERKPLANAGMTSIAGRTFELIYDEVAWDEAILEPELIRAGAAYRPATISPGSSAPGSGVGFPPPMPTPLGSSAKVHVILPWTNLYPITEVIPELIEANMAYGWMRAYEVVNGVAPNACTSDDIVRHLKRLYDLRVGEVVGGQPAIDRTRTDLVQLVDSRKTALGQTSLPPEADGW